VAGREWSPALLDPYTTDWQDLADTITQELNSLYKRSSVGSSFDKVEVEAFSPGSIIVDYYVVFNELQRSIDTQDLKDVVELETRMADNPEEHMLGSLMIDPQKIDFIVVGVEAPEPSTGREDDHMLLPPWAVAVVVIGLASVAFVIIFGVSMVRKPSNPHPLYPSHPPAGKEKEDLPGQGEGRQAGHQPDGGDGL
jgi:hypothetical protein